MKFKNITERLSAEKSERKDLYKKLLTFGVSFLDKSMRGILPDDLILIGARSGVGKTQFAVNMALSNVEHGRRVHIIALEASENEIERRMKYALISKLFFLDENRPTLGGPINFLDWALGKFDGELKKYEDTVDEVLGKYKTLFTFYKADKFGVVEMTENILDVADETDLVIVDHVHYFDFETENENQALKVIAKTAREITQVIKKPLVLVAHLRKADARHSELVPGLDEFHGSSDLSKIATKVITLSKGEMIEPGKFETYFRIPKCRIDGSATYYVGRVIFELSTQSYQPRFELGRLKDFGKKFESIEPQDIPHWLKQRRAATWP